jgi:hypothetical protein
MQSAHRRPWVVQSSSLAQIKVGDVLLKIGDIAVEDFFRQQQKYISGSNESAKRHNLFFLAYLFPEQLTVTLDDGRKTKVDRAARNLPAEKERGPEGHWPRGNITAYIRIPSTFLSISILTLL